MTQKDIENHTTDKPLWDQGSPHSIKGLHVRAFKNGSKSFYLYYRTRAGKQRRPRLGACSILTIEQARKIAKDMLVQVAMGGDPQAEKRELRAEMTIRELFEKVYDLHWSKQKFQDSGYAEEVKKNWRNHLEKPFGRLKVSELTAGMVREWHDQYESSPYAGNRSLAVLQKLYSIAEEYEWRPQNTNPCKLVRSHPEKVRARYATDAEIAKVGRILEREAASRPAAVAFIYLLIYTGSRPSAIERATWDDIEVRESSGVRYGLLKVAGKTGVDEVVIPPQALALLASLRETTQGSLTGIKMPKEFWAQVRDEAGCPDLWARDWRRTFGTIALSDGVSLDQIGELLNHKDIQTTKNCYARLKDEVRNTAAKRVADRLEKLMKA